MKIVWSLSVILVASLSVLRAGAYSTETINGITWYYEKNGQSASLGYRESVDWGTRWKYYPAIAKQTKGDIVIPPRLGGCEVSVIYDTAFSECTNLTSVTMPETITSVGLAAFQSCTQLTNINLSSGLREIGQHAFNNCQKIVSIVLPNGVTNIADYVFSNCMGLEDIVIPNSVVSIGSQSFYNCVKLRHITIPSSIRDIGYCAFSVCTSLGAIEFEGNSPSVNGAAFVWGASINSNCCAYVRNDSSGWGVDIPGIWNKILIDYARYVISFAANGGEGIMPEQTICLGETIGLSPCTFTRNGCVFDGWSTSEEDITTYTDGQQVKDLIDERGGRVILRAVWKVATPVILSEGETTFYNPSQMVSINCELGEATILYTTDGSNPLTNGREYKTPFPIYESCNVRVVAVKDNLHSAETSMTFTRAEGLSEAVNLYGYLMENDSTSPWTVVTDVSHDGVSCVRSGAIGNNGTTAIQTSVKKAGTLSFWWRAACEEPDVEDGADGYYDYGAFVLDGTDAARIAGNDTGWQFFSTNITTGGKHVFRWEYRKDGATTYVPDCVWLDQVQWIPADGSGYTLTTPDPVPYSWLSGYGLGLDSDFETAAKQLTGKTSATGKPMAVWQDFVAGTNPTDSDDFLRTMIAFSNGVPCVSWSPNLNTNGEVRVYTVLGKTNLTDAAWVCPTNAAHRFFKVKVEMP